MTFLRRAASAALVAFLVPLMGGCSDGDEELAPENTTSTGAAPQSDNDAANTGTDGGTDSNAPVTDPTSAP